MGVAVLNPRDCLKNSSFPQSLPKIKVVTSPPAANPKPNRNSSGRGRPNNRPKRDLNRPLDDSRPARSTPASTVKPQLNQQPVMGQVKILKRGELLTAAPKTPSPASAPPPAPVVEQADPVKTDLASTSSNPVKGLAGFYAGSSMFVASPPPSSVPLPAFFTKKSINDPTMDLRRILESEGILGL